MKIKGLSGNALGNIILHPLHMALIGWVARMLGDV